MVIQARRVDSIVCYQQNKINVDQLQFVNRKITRLHIL